MKPQAALETLNTALSALNWDPPLAHESVSIHKLTHIEEAAWDRFKDEKRTKEDWRDLNAVIIAWKRRFIARHAAKTT